VFYLKIIKTKHATDKAKLWAVTDEQIRIAIKRGSKYKQTDGLLAVYMEYEIAYKVIGNDLYLIKTIKMRR